MEFFKKTNIDFLGIKKFTSALSIIICVLSLACIAVKGINFDLDFTGGYSIQANYPESVDTTVVHKSLDKAGF